jgi:tRNA pseudouridine32 synthase / 23S rRNA pseudouridine746 synthase
LGRAEHPSTVTMPNTPGSVPSILEFLCRRFPAIPQGEWLRRILDGKVLDDGGLAITPATPYVPGKRLFYFREIADEPVIPFTEQILFQDEHLLVADKPHFLPVVPSGPYVEECLLARLRRSTGIADLTPLHRIDRETAGLVLFSVNKTTRGPYAGLFRTGAVEKEYQAISASVPGGSAREWSVEDRIERGEPWFRMRIVPGPANARSLIELVEIGDDRSRFLLRPLTGRKHQLRLHMCSLGFPILNDRCYPDLQPESRDDFSAPLQLLAQGVRFRDPLTDAVREFASGRGLDGVVPDLS